MVEIADKPQDAADVRWKARYLGALDAHERLEKEAGTRVGELGGLMVRLARALPPAESGSLCKRLGSLSDALKRRPLDPDLSGDVREVHDRILDVMDARERERTQLHEALSDAAKQLEEVCSGRAFKRRLKAFRASLGRREPAAASVLVGALGELQGAALEAAPAASATDDLPAGEISPAQRPSGPVPGVAAAGPSAAAPVVRDGAGAVVDWPAVRQVLASLLARVELPEQLREQSVQVTRTLEESLDEDGLLAVLEAIRDLMDSALSAMNGEFRGFLDSVDRRLDTLLSSLGQARADGDAVRELERGMADSFQASIAAMRTDAAGATRLEDLKSSIDSHLECLVSSVQEFRVRGDSLGDERDARLEAMTSRLRALESESREVRGQLEAQRQLARTDALTGLANRQAMDERLTQEVARFHRHGTPLALALADIDHFKRVNDRYGHQAGDRALALFAGIIARRIRQTDFCARYGGEEFLILFPGTDAASAAGAVEQIRAFVERCGFTYKGEPVPLTASFGVTGLVSADDVASALERTDGALYAAKNEGRNRVVCRS